MVLCEIVMEGSLEFENCSFNTDCGSFEAVRFHVELLQEKETTSGSESLPSGCRLLVL